MKSADISIIGPDSKGIVATITNFIFENQNGGAPATGYTVREGDYSHYLLRFPA